MSVRFFTHGLLLLGTDYSLNIEICFLKVLLLQHPRLAFVWFLSIVFPFSFELGRGPLDLLEFYRGTP
jgi:hypothetical protein